MPGFDVIGYQDWAAQCQHKFSQGLIKQVSYQGLKIINPDGQRIMFKTIETLETTDGHHQVMRIEVIQEKEADDKWHLTQERVLPQDELDHDRQIGLF